MPDFCGTMMSCRPSMVTSIGGAEKSWSGPITAGQPLPSLFGGHPPIQLSFGVPWYTHFTRPVATSIATTASVIGPPGSAYALPVATYTEPRAASTVGDDQIPPPAGP